LTAYDLTLASELPVLGALAAGSATRPDAVIRIGAETIERDPGAAPAIYQRDQDTLVFSAPEVARYRCRADEIAVEPYADAAPDDVVALLIATALPALLWSRDDFVLHAAAVRLPGSKSALAIAGESGSGKSTAAAALIGHGASLIADDSVRLRMHAGGVEASGLAGGYFMCGPDGDRPFHRVPSSQSLARCALGAIVVLAPGDGEARLERLTSLRAIEQLLRHRHRFRIPSILGRDAEILRFCASTVREVPVYIWRRRRGPAYLGEGELHALESACATEDRR
jgi:hypothetical protein